MTVGSEAVIAANRFGLGARPGELAQVNSDPRGWLSAQIKGAREAPEPIRKLPRSPEVFAKFAEAQEMRREAKQEQAKDAAQAAAIIQTLRKVIAPIYLDQVAARYQVACNSEEPFRERLIHFWTNHFAVSADKAAVIGLAATLENEAIRPNLHRRFSDMLLAVESHPAMILYLDNQASVGPNSRLGQAAARRGRDDRKIGINENLGREILELHTLGVDGGYSQADVTTFAQVLTGWSVGGGQGRLKAGAPGEFIFRENIHEPGPKTILGKHYAEDGRAQAETVLKDLAAHPATARHIAAKLVRHFVADEPTPSAVDRVAKVFRDTHGDLPSVHRAVFELPEIWKSPQPKFKTQNEFVISAFRAFDYVPAQPRQVAAPFELLGQRPYTPGSPAGWPDTASQWDGPDALMKRIEWATQMAQRAALRSSPLEMAERTLGSSLSEHTHAAIANASDAVQGLTLWLVSPEFLRR